MSEWETEWNVHCVVCPKCAFTFDASHTETTAGETKYVCPVCEPTPPFKTGSTYTVPDLEGTMIHVPVPRGYTLLRDVQKSALNAAATLLSDLDRCRHGRHRGDVCGGSHGCNGPSQGNTFLRPGDRIGTRIGGEPIIVPIIPPGERKDLCDAMLWWGTE